MIIRRIKSFTFDEKDGKFYDDQSSRKNGTDGGVGKPQGRKEVVEKTFKSDFGELLRPEISGIGYKTLLRLLVLGHSLEKHNNQRGGIARDVVSGDERAGGLAPEPNTGQRAETHRERQRWTKGIDGDYKQPFYMPQVEGLRLQLKEKSNEGAIVP